MVDASLRATILGSLRELNQERGISIIYITHDLATAYQVADNIIVLYRASVAEAGDVELVVKAPQHPYTQLLIASIPQVSTERSWLDEPEVRQLAQVPAGSCKFVARCPVSMPICQRSAPPLFRTEARRVVACFQSPTPADAARCAGHRAGPDLNELTLSTSIRVHIRRGARPVYARGRRLSGAIPLHVATPAKSRDNGARGEPPCPITMHRPRLDARHLARLPDPAGAGLSGPGEARGDGGADRQVSAAGVRRRGAAAEGASGARPPRARRSCCKAATAPRASPTSPPTSSATRSACCCRWRWC